MCIVCVVRRGRVVEVGFMKWGMKVREERVSYQSELNHVLTGGRHLFNSTIIIRLRLN